MYIDNKLYVAHCDNGPLYLTGKMCNRHGLIAGATGTGKTVSLQVMAETFSQAGVPCFMADMKGDLSGIAQKGELTGFIEKRLKTFGIESPEFQACPVRFYDVYGEEKNGFPMRATISSMGPQLLARLMDLNDTQSGVLNIVFRIAEDNQLLLIDLKDLRLMLDFVGKNAAKFTTAYGNIAAASVGAIQRSILALESEGGDKFFGEPAFDIEDLLDVENGRGVMSVLVADKLMLNPKLYSTFMMWLMTELYNTLPEVGDQELPKLVFFFDEAHMMFENASKGLLEKLEQIVRLIRSKGVGIYFITQLPTDLPYNILGQLGNRVQHALHAYTPKEQKAVRTAAETFRANPNFKTEDAIMELETGEALVSFLDEKGAPTVVERAKMLFPLSHIGPITAGQRLDIQDAAPEKIKKYKDYFDRESAYEKITAENEQVAAQEEAVRKAKEAAKAAKEAEKADKEAAKEAARAEKEAAKAAKEAAKEAEKAEKEAAKEAAKRKGCLTRIFTSIALAVVGSVGRSVGSSVGKAVTGKKSTKSSGGDILGRAAKTATTTATRKVTEEVLKSIFK